MIYIDDSEPEGELDPAFPYRDVTIQRGVDANELYNVLSEVGRGKFGTVYQCEEKDTGLKLAAKFVPIPKREDKRNVEREVEIMNSLQHHLIIQLYAAYEYQKMMCVILELVEGGELFDRVVDDEFVLTERVCIVFIRQVCEAMEFIHRKNILHLDLKPENILCLTQEGNRIKLIDFGLARKYDPDKRLQILFGTPEFVAPEVVNFDCIAHGTDMWSVGVICYVLISGLSPFMGETDIETMANVTIAKYDFEDESFSGVSSECLDFIAKLLVKDLSTRMTAAQCLEHKWLQRRPKAPPVVHPKPLNVPPPKLKANSPSPVPANKPQTTTTVNDEETDEEEELADINENLIGHNKELDSTKDNLKNFIERWEEHPNSPYVFDVEGNVIAPLSETPYKQMHGQASLSSSRVCSPSPCQSIDTITDDEEAIATILEVDTDADSPPSTLATPVNESREKLFTSGSATPSSSTTPTPLPQQYASQHLFGDKWNQMGSGEDRREMESLTAGHRSSLHQRSIKSYLHTFDRRNSDTNCLLGRRTSGERVNLADEIRKLSDHLLMLADINSKLGNANKTNTISSLATAGIGTSVASEKTKDTKTVAASSTKSSSSSSKTTSSTSTVSKTTKMASSSSKTTATTSSTSSKTTTSSSSAIKSSKLSSISKRLEQSIEETPKLQNGALPTPPWRTGTKSNNTSTNATTNGVQTAEISSITQSASSTSATKSTASSTSSATSTTTSNSTTKMESASTRRAKFRINQMSRDVPVGLPDTHQTVNLEEAANTTKDCLLHLLEKYNEAKGRNPLGRHQSISVDWNNISENLEYRSMSSINAFFQRHNNSSEKVKHLQAQLEQKATVPGSTSGKNT